MAIPIHTMPENQDPILTGEVPCPKYDKLRQELVNSQEYREMLQEHTQLFQNISEVTGYPADGLDFGTFSGLFQDITIYREYNLLLPEWTDYYWPEISSLAAINYKINTYTQAMARLRTGPFFDYLLDYLNSVQNYIKYHEDSGVPPKFLMLSAHDNTISDRTNAMGVFPDVVPEYACTVIWEVRSSILNNDDLYVNLYFKNSTDFSPLTVPGCDFNCDLEKYAELLKQITVSVEQWTKECYEK